MLFSLILAADTIFLSQHYGNIVLLLIYSNPILEWVFVLYVEMSKHVLVKAAFLDGICLSSISKEEKVVKRRKLKASWQWQRAQMPALTVQEKLLGSQA